MTRENFQDLATAFLLFLFGALIIATVYIIMEGK